MRKIYSKIESITGNVITVTADNVKNDDLAEVQGGIRLLFLGRLLGSGNSGGVLRNLVIHHPYGYNRYFP